ncbi:uncharacterized protein LOC142236501 [Haematobia irritans]|uniref:uncharacterized protein LOC142236501 n=1 Tax=Haematobia irritans TaxID=7368 RepID=UPI003F50A6C4
MTSLCNFIRTTDNLTIFNSGITEDLLTSSSVHSLEVHREELREIWGRVKLSYEESLKEVSMEPGEEAKNDLETLQTRYQTVYITYVACVARLSECIEKKRTFRVPVEIPNSPHINLPPCDTEVFHGDYSSWPTFRDLFTAIYVNNSRLSLVEKLYHLNNKTRGEAREIVRKAPLTNDGFEVAWKALKDRFENKRLLINSQLKILFNLDTISSETSGAIKTIQSTINNVISSLKLYQVEVAYWDPIFVYLCCTKLPETTLSLWEQSVKTKTECPSWSELDTFLTTRFQTLETVCDFSNSVCPKTTVTSSKIPQKGQSPKKINSFQNGVHIPSCKLCPKENHTIRLCPKFIAMCLNDRLACIKRLKLCMNCFSKSHIVKDCKSRYSCMHCNQRHHTYLHQQSPNFGQNNINSVSDQSASGPSTSHSDTSTDQSNSDSAINQIQSCAATGSKNVLLGTAVVDIIHNGDIFKARALFDSGSEATFVSQNFFNLLKLESDAMTTEISGLNGSISAWSSRSCSLKISSHIQPNILIDATAIVIPKLTSSLPTFPANPNMFRDMPNIQLADPEFYKSSYIDILFGSDVIPAFMLTGVLTGVCGTLMAQETVFGWVLSGPIPITTVQSFRATVSYHNNSSLDQQISKLWEVEDFPKKKQLTISEKICEDNFEKTTKRNSSGRYVVTLPFKEEFQKSLKLGQSKGIALAQFLRNESRLSKNRDLNDQYSKVLNEYIELSHMKKVKSIPNFDYENCYYMPHHAVIRPESSTTKVRVVFNASCPSSNGLSLNDTLHCGPSLQNDLVNLLLQWRFYKVVFNSDIEKMYRQILIDPQQTQFQKILYRSSPESDISEYELQTVTFGVNCAPYLALRTIQQLAVDVKDIYPLASDVLQSCMYVDDVLAGSHDVTSSIRIKDELISALSSAGFSLRKWTSNSKEFLRSIPKEHLLNDEFLEFDDCSMAKTLGVRWNARLDHFYFSAKSLNVPSNPTKRQILSEISKLFDPAGWLCPYILLAKLLMRDIWVSKIDWDDSLNSQILESWNRFVEAYSNIEEMQIPRWIGYSPGCEVQIHGFCDASEKAYAAAIYIRIESPLGVITTHLLAAKSKVSPLKTISIPRLELCGALLLSETIDSLQTSFPIESYELYCWTDSMIVLAWLQKPAYQWKTFVANRVSKITEIVNNNHWSHVESKDNPADIGSRGAYPHEFMNNELWRNGPSWLKLPSSSWPKPTVCPVNEDLLERKINAKDDKLKVKRICVNFVCVRAFVLNFRQTLSLTWMPFSVKENFKH